MAFESISIIFCSFIRPTPEPSARALLRPGDSRNTALCETKRFQGPPRSRCWAGTDLSNSDVDCREPYTCRKCSFQTVCGLPINPQRDVQPGARKRKRYSQMRSSRRRVGRTHPRLSQNDMHAQHPSIMRVYLCAPCVDYLRDRLVIWAINGSSNRHARNTPWRRSRIKELRL